MCLLFHERSQRREKAIFLEQRELLWNSGLLFGMALASTKTRAWGLSAQSKKTWIHKY
jgi:hypothetical protein